MCTCVCAHVFLFSFIQPHLYLSFALSVFYSTRSLLSTSIECTLIFFFCIPLMFCICRRNRLACCDSNSIIPEGSCDYHPSRNSYLDHQLTVAYKLVASLFLSSFLIDLSITSYLNIFFSLHLCYFSGSLFTVASRCSLLLVVVMFSRPKEKEHISFSFHPVPSCAPLNSSPSFAVFHLFLLKCVFMKFSDGFLSALAFSWLQVHVNDM